jgi:hypothetical protein
MREFVDTALGFPTVLFSFLLLVVAGYWVFVLVTGMDFDDGDDGFLGAIGLGGVPAIVTLSVLVVVAWFVSLAGSVLVGRTGFAVAAFAVLLLALGFSWVAARLLLPPLRRLFPEGEGPSRHDFVGTVCIVRTGQVDRDFGQAEVTAPDGSSAIIQVRQTGRDSFRAGMTALIYDYDADGEFFWIVPVDAPLGTERDSSS